MRRCTAVLLLAGLLSVLSGCGQPPSAENSTDVKAPIRVGGPSEMRIALVPSEDTARMIDGFEPIRAHLVEQLGVPVSVIPVTDYSSAIEALKSAKAEAAWFGPLTYHIARQEANVEPVAVGLDPVKGKTYKALILVRADSQARALQDLKGKDMAFVDPGSTSGFLVPSYMVLKETGQKADAFFGKTIYAGSHDAALLALKNRAVDACAVQDVTFADLSRKGVIKKEDFRILAESSPIPGSPIAIRADLNEEFRKRFATALLTAHEKGVRLEVPGMGSYEKFVAVDPADYQFISDMVTTLGLSNDQLNQ